MRAGILLAWLLALAFLVLALSTAPPVRTQASPCTSASAPAYTVCMCPRHRRQF